jgi:hypothetical protein
MKRHNQAQATICKIDSLNSYKALSRRFFQRIGKFGVSKPEIRLQVESRAVKSKPLCVSLRLCVLARDQDFPSAKQVSRKAAKYAKIAKTDKSVCTGRNLLYRLLYLSFDPWFRAVFDKQFLLKGIGND